MVVNKKIPVNEVFKNSLHVSAIAADTSRRITTDLMISNTQVFT